MASPPTARLRRRVAVGAIVVGSGLLPVVGAACTGGSVTASEPAQLDASGAAGNATSTTDAGTAPGSRPPATEPAVGPEVDSELDTRKAERALLTARELTGGTWSELRDPEPPEVGPLGVDCGAFTADVEEAKEITDAAPSARSKVFSVGQGVELSEVVVVFGSADEADRVEDVYTDPSMPGCVAKIVIGQSTEDAAPGVSVVGEPKVEELRVLAKADASFGFQVSLVLDNNGTRAPVYATFAYVRIGRAIAELQLVTLGAPSRSQVNDLAEVTQIKLRDQFG